MERDTSWVDFRFVSSNRGTLWCSRSVSKATIDQCNRPIYQVKHNIDMI